MIKAIIPWPLRGFNYTIDPKAGQIFRQYSLPNNIEVTSIATKTFIAIIPLPACGTTK